MNNYQLTLVLKSSLPEASRKKLVETVKSWIKDAKILKEEEWGEKPLSYIIKKEKSGFYHNFLLELEQDLAKDFIKKLHASDGVIRHLLLKTQKTLTKN